MAAYFVTASLMGKDPNQVDWRKIFIILGLVGIGLAVIVRIVIREPKRGSQEIVAGGEIVKRSFGKNLATLLTIPSWWFMAFGIAFASFASYAFNGFQTKYVRLLDPDYDFRQVIIILGIINGVAYAGGTYLGAKLADKWGEKDLRAYGWVPALAICIALPSGIASFWVGSVNAHLVCAAILLSVLGAYLGPSFAIAQTLAPIHMRALSTALFFFILNMIALGGGPSFAGTMIDVFEKAGHSSVHATRLAMTATCGAFVIGIAFFLLATLTLRKDWAAAEVRNESSNN